MKVLAITNLCEGGGPQRWRLCGKLWVASLLRHLWQGKILIRRSSEHPLFSVERTGVDEEFVVADRQSVSWKAADLRDHARRLQLESLARSEVKDFDWVLLADADCIALRNLDHLFEREAEVLVSRVRGGIDPGFFAVRGAEAAKFGTQLVKAGGLEPEPLDEVLREGSWKVGEFERGEVVRPSDPGVTLNDLATAAVVHFSGMETREKQRLAFAFHMMAVYADDQGLFMEILEA